MTKTKTPTDDGGNVRAAMAALSKRSLADLRTAYEATTHRPAKGLSRAVLIKSLVTLAEEQPPASHPTKAEQAAAKAPRASTRKADPRFPVGATIRRTYKGTEHVLEVLADGFKVGEKVFRSPTAAALSIVPYGAVSGPLFWGVTKPAKAPEAVPETPKTDAPPAPAKKKAGRPISPKRR